MQKYLNRFAQPRRQTLLVGMALVASVAAMSVVSPAIASAESGFEVFKECPTGNPSVELCLHAKTEGGYFTIGKRTVPIKNPVTLQGGIIEPNEFEQKFVAAKTESNTLSKTAQPVPGGLLDIVAPEYLNKEQKEKFEEAINKGPTGVNATVELAAPASSIFIFEGFLFAEEGPALILPVKVHLENTIFLGSNCYIGSNSSPIDIELTTGESGKLHGKLGLPFFTEDGEILNIAYNSLVNQTFKAPGANGCGAFGLADLAVNAELGLPAEKAGENSAVLEGTLMQATAHAVTKHGE
jgi:hypothetical protein